MPFSAFRAVAMPSMLPVSIHSLSLFVFVCLAILLRLFPFLGEEISPLATNRG
jgi:hypothetical protein